jgi:hypothetical protein
MKKYDIPYLKKGPFFDIIHSCKKIKSELAEYNLPTVPADIILLDSIIDQSYDFLERIDHYRTERKKIP